MTPPADTSLPKGNDEPFNGIAIGSFLQMLEQEMKSCTVIVKTGRKQGLLFLDEGILIDAEYDEYSGLDAASKIVCWEDTAISLAEPVHRALQIKTSLGHILLNAACQQDEEAEQNDQDETMAQPTITYTIKEAETDPAYQSSIDALLKIEAIRTFFLFNKAGKVAVHSATNTALGELIIYCIVTCNNLKKSVQTKALRRIQLQMKDGSSLLILPLAGKIMGMVLEAESSADEIVSRIQASLKTT